MRTILLACLLALAGVTTTRAEDDPRISAAMSLLDAMQFEQQLEGIRDAMVPLMEQQRDAVLRTMDVEISPKVMAIANHYTERMVALTLSDAQVAEMRGNVAAVYAEVFTLEEIEGIAAFYATDIGQSMLRKMPEATRQTLELTMASQQALATEITSLVQEMRTEIEANAGR
ncbi:MAG: DUF2059 domain-containing protein [Pseudomonadota bacterium]